MKFDCYKPNPKTTWHLWFAWYPIKLDKHDCRWLELVWRKGTYISDIYELGSEAWWGWEYKSL